MFSPLWRFEEVEQLTRVMGVVDGVVGNDLCGWIINQDKASRLEPVICRGSGGSARFVPFTYREDVVAAVGQTGVFGFAIPLDLLAPLGKVVEVSDQYGRTLSHGEHVELPEPAEPPPPGPINIFLHIPKTAGTSLRNTLLGRVPRGEFMLLYPGKAPGLSLQRSHCVRLAQRNRLRWIFGHCKFGYDRFVTRPCRYYTFIREPLQRLRSNFAHHAAAGTRFNIDGVGVRPSVMLVEGLTEEFDNLMTRFLAGLPPELVPLGEVGEDEVELALRNVREHFDFIGLQSRASADLQTLQDHLGTEQDSLPLDNVTPSAGEYPESEMAAVDWGMVAARNRADLLLYRRLQEEGLVSRPLRR